MLNGIDLTDRNQVEQLRRSVAMLRPGDWALNREDALRVLKMIRDLATTDR